MSNVAICLFHKNENQYLEEWMAYHTILGVRHFFIYDNGSDLSVSETLGEYIGRGLVTLIDWPQTGERAQISAYQDCLQTQAERWDWIGFIDTDEYLILPNGKTAAAFFEDYEKNGVGGVALHWRIYGSGGFALQPQKPQIESYLKRTPDLLAENRTVKSFVRPEWVLWASSPHHFIYKPGAHCVDEHLQRVDGMDAPFSGDRAWINHYWCRSRAEYAEKLIRGRGDAGDPYNWRRYEYYDELATILDECALRRLTSFSVCVTEGEPLLEKMRAAALAVLPPDAPAATLTERADLTGFNHWIDQLLIVRDGALQDRVAVLEQLLQEYPHVPGLWASLGRVKTAMGDISGAAGYFQEGLARFPGNYDLLEGLAALMRKAGHPNYAETILESLVKLDPANFKLFADWISLLFSENKHEKGFKELSEGLLNRPLAFEFPDTAWLVMQAAGWNFEQGNLARARAILEKALALQPENIEMLVSLGRVALDQGDLGKAKQVMDRAARLSPADEEIKTGLRLIGKRMGCA